MPMQAAITLPIRFNDNDEIYLRYLLDSLGRFHSIAECCLCRCEALAAAITFSARRPVSLVLLIIRARRCSRICKYTSFHDVLQFRQVKATPATV